MFNPCFEHCYNRYGKQYSSECDEKCEFAKMVKEKKIIEEELEQYKLGDCMNNCEHYDNCANYIYSKGYNKAINDCKTYIGLHRKYAEHSIDDYVNYLQIASWLNNKIAEQINSK